MKAHRDKKEFPIYSLQVAKGGSALKEVADAEGPLDYGTGNLTREGTATFNFGSGSMLIFGDNKIESRQLPLSIFADTLGRYMDRPVVDMTELKGRYNFVLNLTPGDFLAMRILSAVSAGVPLAPQVLRSLDGASFGSLSNALEKIGLRFQSAKAPLDVLVIDSIQKRPTDN
jgi:uncharacterized protein (TIGR03435 family)